MMTVCLRYARNRADAEDILQDGFVRLFQNLHQFKFQGSFEGWVRRIFVNAALKKYQAKKWQNEQTDIEEVNESSIQPDIVSRMSEQEILNLVTKLPEGYRVVFNMYVIEGYAHKEIAKELGINEATSRTQLLKARKHLQTQIDKMMSLYES